MDNNWYRITIVPNVVLELNRYIAVIESKHSNLDFMSAQHFHQLGINIILHVKSFKGLPVFLTLDGNNYLKYENWHKSHVAKYDNIEFGGSSSFAYSATFSDQIIQGLRFSGKEN